MTGLGFADSNVFVYQHDLPDPAKQEGDQQWIETASDRRCCKSARNVC